MIRTFQPGELVSLRGRDWVVLPSKNCEVLVIKPLGGSDHETTGIYLPLNITEDTPCEASFPLPDANDLGDISTARYLYESARLAFRNGAGPFRAMAKLSFRPRAYQIVPLIMALRQRTVRLLIADDVGVGKTIEALLIIRELMERAKISRFAVVCLPHLCDQWQLELKTKLNIDAVIIRSNTQARLDRKIQGDTSVYHYYPYQIISIDYIKADIRRAVFIAQCPELVIVDEAHTCTLPAGSSKVQHQRYHLLKDLADKPTQHLVLLTATPHSGKPEEFQSLLGLLKHQFVSLSLAESKQNEREEVATCFIQRKRSDIEMWMGEETPFPNRDAEELPYYLSPKYAKLFNDLVKFVRKLLKVDHGLEKKRAYSWMALGLLRGVMSSPATGIKMLSTKLEKLEKSSDDVQSKDKKAEVDRNSVGDPESEPQNDIVPVHVMQQASWSKYQRDQLRRFSNQLASFCNLEDDQKLFAASLVLEDWLRNGCNAVVFCRFIETAKYLGRELSSLLVEKFPELIFKVVTSELPDDLRKQRIEEMSSGRLRLLIATDCLSEGINLQDLFNSVLHYDLPWNPNRLEQREGRVDRFGQSSKNVNACLIYASDSPIDGIVLDVLLRKVRKIRKATGINVPFPEDSQDIIETITQSLLLNPNRPIQTEQTSVQLSLFDSYELDEIAEAKSRVTRKIEAAAEREKKSRSIFAQNKINANEIEKDLRAIDTAIGNPKAVRKFVTGALEDLLGVQVIRDKTSFEIVTGNLPPSLSGLLPEESIVNVSFDSPTPDGLYYLGRNHPFVEQLCHLIMANTIERKPQKSARAAVIRTPDVTIKTTLLLLRCRNVIKQKKGNHQVVAEEMIMWGWRGIPDDKDFLDQETANKILSSVRASENLSIEAQRDFLNFELQNIEQLSDDLDDLAESRSKFLLEVHERFSKLVENKSYKVVYPVLPMDVMGIYILLPS